MQRYAKICQKKWKMKKGKKAWKARKYWKYEKNQDFIHLPRQHLSFPHGRICYEKIGIRRESRRSLPDCFRCHQHGGDLERHREPGLSAGEGGACQARDLLWGEAGQAGDEGGLCGIWLSDRYGQCEYPQHAADIRRRSGWESSQAFILCRLGTGYIGSMVHGRVWDDLQWCPGRLYRISSIFTTKRKNRHVSWHFQHSTHDRNVMSEKFTESPHFSHNSFADELYHKRQIRGSKYSQVF